MKQEDVWRGIDRLADEIGVTPARLARMAGLDQAVFSAGRRRRPEGGLRWPSMDSLAKVLDVADISIGDFVNYMHGDPATRSGFLLPTLPISTAAEDDNYDEDGFPTGPAWDRIEFPDIQDPYCFGIVVQGDGYEPVYRDGNLLICAPGMSIRRGDRVAYRLARTASMPCGLFIGVLLRQTPFTLDIGTLDGSDIDVIAAQDLTWITRIAWARQ